MMGMRTRDPLVGRPPAAYTSRSGSLDRHDAGWQGVMKRRLLLLSLLAVGTPVASAAADHCLGSVPPNNPDVIYRDNSDGTVTDRRSGLRWKRCSEGQTELDGACLGETTGHDWLSALSIASDSTFAGRDDWRLPNVKELLSLAEHCRYAPAINTSVFPATPGEFYWVSSPMMRGLFASWLIDFHHGSINGTNQVGQFRVRLVADER
jgi:hypothetical protein